MSRRVFEPPTSFLALSANMSQPAAENARGPGKGVAKKLPCGKELRLVEFSIGARAICGIATVWIAAVGATPIAKTGCGDFFRLRT